MRDLVEHLAWQNLRASVSRMYSVLAKEEYDSHKWFTNNYQTVLNTDIYMRKQ